MKVEYDLSSSWFHPDRTARRRGNYCLLIAILLPSLGRARDTAKTVRCASNLKQLYTGTTLYASQNDGTMMPACMIQTATVGNFASELWAGFDMLGPMFGTASTGAGMASGVGGTVSQASVVAQMEKMLDCPVVDHNAAWGGIIDVTNFGSTAPWYYDYTYNECMGQEQVIPSNKTADGITLNCCQASSIPRATILACDDRSRSANHDYYFGTDTHLLPVADPIGGTINNANGIVGDQLSNVGVVHKQGKQTNMVFCDGSIITDDATKLLPIGTHEWVINWH